MGNKFKDKFFNIASEVDSILLCTHKDPDGDAAASLLSVYYILFKKYPNKNIQMMVSTPINERFSSFIGFEDIESVEDVSDYMQHFDLAVFVDANYDERFVKNKDKYHKFAGKRVFIDHHPDKNEKHDLKYIDPEATSTSELVYFLFLEDEEEMSQELAEVLMMGLISDTGGFKYINPKYSRVFLMAKRLVDAGNIKLDSLWARFTGYNERVFKILKEFINNSKIEEVEGWPKFVYSYITRDFIEEGNYTLLETEEASDIFTDYLKAMRNVTWGFVARNYSQIVKVSLRSRIGSVNVREVAEGMGRGSGHDNSAGAKFTGLQEKQVDVSKVVEEIKNWLEQNNPIFTKE